MAGPGLSTTRTAGSTGHIADTNTVHGIVNGFDTALKTATTGQALTWNGSVYAPGTPSAGSLQYPTAGSQLQGMLDAQNAGTAGIIILGPQTYTITTALLLYSGSTIIGMGPNGSTISYTGTGGNAIVASNQTVRGYSWNLEGFLLQDSGTGAVGINMVKQSTTTITNVKVDGFTTGISMTGVGGETVYNRFISVQVANATTGILCGTDGSNSNSFIGCRTNVCTLAVQITDSDQNIFVGCQFESGTNGVAITSTTNALSDSNAFTNCRFEALSGIRINVTSAFVRYTMLIGNAFFGSGTSDITDSGTRTQIIDSSNPFKMNPPSKPAVTGSRGSNAALASLLTTLAAAGLILDSTTA